jgi:autotransporter-associated beta strand protein
MNRIKLGASLLTLGVVCGLVGPSFGVDRTWTGAGANANWSNTTNWVGGVVGGNWEGVIFDANTVAGLVGHDVGGGCGTVVLTNGLTQDVILRNASQPLIQNNNYGFTVTADSRDLVLSLYGQYLRIFAPGTSPWFVGSGRTLTANCLIGESGIAKTGQGTVLFARENTDNRWELAVNEGTVKTVIDQTGSLNKWTVASGATWVFGAQKQTIFGLWGNGAVKSPTGDTAFMGPITGVNGELISTNRNYVYKLDFGTGGGATVNGVVFDAVWTSGAGWVLSGANTLAGGDSGSGFAQFVNDFLYGAFDGSNSALTFTNLTVGTKYEAVIYSAPSWGSRIQNAIFSNGTDVVTLRDTDPAYTGYYVYRFTANTKIASITMSAVTAHKYHWYGATLEDLTGVTAGSRAATLTVGDGNSHSFSGVLSGDIALVKQGSGTQSLSGTNAYSGATVISNGTLRLEAALVTPVAATAQSAYTPDGRTPVRAIDGTGMSPSSGSFIVYDSTAGNTPQNAMWLSNGTRQTWLTFDLGSVQTLAGLRLWNYNENGNMEINRGVRTAGIYTGTTLLADGSSYASAGAAWGTLVTNMTFAKADRTTTLAGSDYLFAAPVTTRYLQLYVTDNFPGADAYTGISEIRFLSAASPTNILPATTALTISSGGVLDLFKVSQDVATLSGSGAVSNGTLSVTSALYPGGAGVTSTLTLQGLTLGAGASLYWDYSAGGADLVRVLGTANLPANATVRVSATGELPVRATLFQCGTINAPSGVSGWTVVGARGNTRVVIQGNEVQLYSPRGTIISLY